MNIGFDAKRVFHNYAGLGNYSRNLLADLSAAFPGQHFFLYTPSFQENLHTRPFLEESAFIVRLPGHGFGSWWRTKGILNSLKQDQIDLFHGLSNELPMGIRKSGVKSVVTIHDLIFLRNPSWYPFIDRKIYEWKFRRSCREADIIIAVSQSTKRDIIHFFEVNPKKIRVIPPSFDQRFYTPSPVESILRKYHLPPSYFLYVGAISPRKNLKALITALSLLPKSYQLPLVLIGRGRSYRKKLIAFARRNQVDHLLVWRDRVPNDEIPAIFRGARLFLYPSWYEGFGMPVLEALLCNTPVITSNTSSLPEAGGDAALYVNPDNPAELANAIRRICSDKVLESELLSRAKDHVKQFSGVQIAQKVFAVYRETLSA